MAEVSIRDALCRALREELARDRNVFLMGEEVGHYNGAYKVSQGLLDEFGEDRVIDTPIAEAGFAGVGVGAAMAGLRPIIEFMTWNFSLVAIDQIVNNAAKLQYMSGGQLPMAITFRGPQGAGGALAAQHSHILESYYSYMPGLKVVCPSNPAEMYGLLKSSIRDNDPVVFLESEKGYGIRGELPDEEFLTPLGEASVESFNSEQPDCTIIAWSLMHTLVKMALPEAIDQGILQNAELIDPRTLSPLDFDPIVESLSRTNRILIVQEAWENSSYGAWLAAKISRECFDELDAPVELISSLPTPMPYAFNLEEATLPSKEKIHSALKKLLA